MSAEQEVDDFQEHIERLGHLAKNVTTQNKELTTEVEKVGRKIDHMLKAVEIANDNPGWVVTARRSTRAKSPFWKLPGELRNQIYALVLKSEKPCYLSRRDRSRRFPSLADRNSKPACFGSCTQNYGSDWNQNTFKKSWREECQEWYCFCPGVSRIPLLAVCRGFYLEGAGHYYGSTTFIATAKTFEKFAEAIGPICTQHLQRICLVNLECKVGVLATPSLFRNLTTIELANIQYPPRSAEVNLPVTMLSQMPCLKEIRVSRRPELAWLYQGMDLSEGLSLSRYARYRCRFLLVSDDPQRCQPRVLIERAHCAHLRLRDNTFQKRVDECLLKFRVLTVSEANQTEETE
ncbi:hypothetical protein MMC20_001798 [Loxospora ochrophaea]|nr:hypothetical protein [Loxospora ochrophaea]